MHSFLRPRVRRGTTVGATYAVPLNELSSTELEDHKQRLTLQARAGYGPPPRPFCAWRVDDVQKVFHCPRFYGLERFGPPEEDQRVEGDPIAFTFEGTLTPVQERVTRALFDADSKNFPTSGGGIVSLYCGGGKTAWTLYAAARLGRKTCVLVHKAVLRDQWRESIARFCPAARVGIVQGARFEVDGCDVVIAMVMTLAKRQHYDASLMDSFGLVVCDESHHMAAPVMNQALRLFRARYVLGLSATVRRPDGLTPLLYWSLGPLGVHIERDRACDPVKVTVAVYRGAAREVTTRDGKVLTSVMLNMLAAHEGRNRFLVERIAAYRAKGRVVMVLSDRRDQLTRLRDMLNERPKEEDEEEEEEQVGLFVGGIRDADVQLARPVVLCTYPMANEGIDKVELDTVILATPKARVIQAIGRCQRPCATKQAPLVLDVADECFMSLRWSRQRTYSREGYAVQVVDAHDEGSKDDWYI